MRTLKGLLVALATLVVLTGCACRTLVLHEVLGPGGVDYYHVTVINRDNATLIAFVDGVGEVPIAPRGYSYTFDLPEGVYYIGFKYQEGPNYWKRYASKKFDLNNGNPYRCVEIVRSGQGLYEYRCP